MKMLDIHMKARELPFRIAHTVCLATEPTDRATDTCRDVFEEYWDEIVKAIPNVHADFEEYSRGIDEEFIDWLQFKEEFGFILVVDTPVHTYQVDADGEVSGGSYSWGRYCSFVVYGKTMDLALENAVNAVEKYQDAAKKGAKNAAA
ncbi:hypothetical protein KW516_18810 [Vibrio fluvialis]|nr:hypothetical protein [Vibrio fluvialis]